MYSEFVLMKHFVCWIISDDDKAITVSKLSWSN